MARIDRREFLATTGALLGAGLAAGMPGEGILAQTTGPGRESAGRLYWADAGRILLEHNEEVSRWRQARKTLTVPVAEPAGEVWLFIDEYQGNDAPLVVDVNGRRAELAATGKARGFEWASVRAPKGALQRGKNQIVLSTPSDLPGAWILGAEPVSEARASALTTDGGETWLTSGMGVHGLTPAEYVVRLWVDNAPPAPDTPYEPVWERPDHPQLRAIARHFKLADTIKGRKTTIDKVRALSTQVALLWKVGQAPEGYGYNAPWDTFTSVAWMNRGKALGRMRPVAYCVHFSIIMVQFCAAVGITARSVVMEADHPKCPSGHFTCEVWLPEEKRWVYVDPNLDAVYEADGRLLSMADLSEACLGGWYNKVIRHTGPGYGNDPRTAKGGMYERFHQYEGFRRWGVYPRTDFLSNPAAQPVQHGASEYHQTHFIWFDDPRLERRKYFPHYTNDLKALYAPPAR